jgi:hypothetical protein
MWTDNILAHCRACGSPEVRAWVMAYRPDGTASRAHYCEEHIPPGAHPPPGRDWEWPLARLILLPDAPPPAAPEPAAHPDG